MPRLQDLPPELILMICRNIGSAAGLVGFSVTCRQYYNIANAEMYLLDAQKVRDCGPSALHWAAYRNNVDMARKALDAGAKPDQYWFSGHARTEVDEIMSCSPTPAVREFDLTGRYYWTALHLAVARGNEEMVHLLLRYHASVDVFSAGFCSCLNTSIRNTYYPTVAVRCKHTSGDPWTLLHTAFCFGRDSIAKILAVRGAAVYRSSSMQPTLILDIKESRHPRNLLPIPKLAMSMAAFFGCPETLTYLMSLYPNIDVHKGSEGDRSVFCYAVFGEVPETMVPLLINTGTDVVAVPGGRKWSKLLYEACWDGRYAAALLLLKKYGPDIKWGEYTGGMHSLLAGCCRKATHASLGERFSSQYMGVFPFRRTLHHDPIKPSTSWPVCQVNKNAKARYEMIELLLAHGADIETRSKLYGNPTALYLAAECHLHDIVELLLSHGADISTRNEFGNTVLMAAISSGFADSPGETVKCLVENGVDVNAQNLDGDTALHLLHKSIFEGSGDLARFLLQHGAIVNIFNRSGNLPGVDAASSGLNSYGPGQSLYCNMAEIRQL